jgi:hypothetical protein
MPAAYLAPISARCAKVVFDGRPRVLPTAFALARLAWVRES